MLLAMVRTALIKSYFAFHVCTLLLSNIPVVLKPFFFYVAADMADRVEAWRHEIANFDTSLDRSEDASDVTVPYASESKSSGLRYLVRPDEMFSMSRPYPGSMCTPWSCFVYVNEYPEFIHLFF
jgi:hypothetical protein